MNNEDKNGTTPLLIATQEGHTEVVAALLASPRINLKLADNQGRNTYGRAQDHGKFPPTRATAGGQKRKSEASLRTELDVPNAQRHRINPSAADEVEDTHENPDADEAQVGPEEDNHESAIEADHAGHTFAFFERDTDPASAAEAPKKPMYAYDDISEFCVAPDKDGNLLAEQECSQCLEPRIQDFEGIPDADAITAAEATTAVPTEMETTDATAQAHAKTIDALTEKLRLANEELKQYRQRTVGEEQTHGLRQCSRAVDVSKSSFVIDATNFGNQSRFVNDCRDISKSGKPNAEFVNRVEKGGDCNAKMWLKCIKTIVKGQEVSCGLWRPTIAIANG